MFPPDARLLASLAAAGLLPPAQAAAIAEAERTRPFSLHYELRALLYLGVVLLAGGLGVLIYEYRDSLGHSVITGGIVVAMLGSFWYAARHRPAFTWGEAPRSSIAADYLLLLGCLLFAGLVAYVQYQYGLFGHRYGLATVLPALLFLPLAYRYDHRGVLGLGIAALGAWVGVSTAPLAVLRGELWREALALPALGLGLALVGAGLASEYWRRKPHFAFTYLLAGANLAEVGTLVQAFASWDAGWPTVPWLLLALGLALGLVWYARRTGSYVFLLLGAAYGYAAVTLLGVLLTQALGRWAEVLWPLLMLYFPLSLGGLVLLLLNLKKILRRA